MGYVIGRFCTCTCVPHRENSSMGGPALFDVVSRNWRGCVADKVFFFHWEWNQWHPIQNSVRYTLSHLFNPHLKDRAMDEIILYDNMVSDGISGWLGLQSWEPWFHSISTCSYLFIYIASLSQWLVSRMARGMPCTRAYSISWPPLSRDCASGNRSVAP